MMMTNADTVYTTEFVSWEESVPLLLAGTGLAQALTGLDRPVLIKPNLVEALAPPITTPVELVRELIDFLRANTDATIIIGEGSGAMEYGTWHAFDKLGYTELEDRLQVERVDRNSEAIVCLRRPACRRWQEMHLPRIALESFLLSVPVLKVHTLAGVTLTMKNMMGLAPPSHYRRGGSWKKSAFHTGIQEAIADLNRYRAPDFTLLDATVGMAHAHLWGPTCNPPVNILAAGYDPVAIDAYGTTLLQRNWREIGHIRQVDGELGQADSFNLTVI